MPQANKVLIAKFKPPFLTIREKLTHIIIAWQAICDHLEEKEHSGCPLFTSGPGTVRKRSGQLSVALTKWRWRGWWAAGSGQCVSCPAELTEAEKYHSRRKSALHQITFYSSLNKSFLGCLQLSWLGSSVIDPKCMHRAILIMGWD